MKIDYQRAVQLRISCKNRWREWRLSKETSIGFGFGLKARKIPIPQKRGNTSLGANCASFKNRPRRDRQTRLPQFLGNVLAQPVSLLRPIAASDFGDCENLICHCAAFDRRNVFGLLVHAQSSDLRSIGRPNLTVGLPEASRRIRRGVDTDDVAI